MLLSIAVNKTQNDRLCLGKFLSCVEFMKLGESAPKCNGVVLMVRDVGHH